MNPLARIRMAVIRTGARLSKLHEKADIRTRHHELCVFMLRTLGTAQPAKPHIRAKHPIFSQIHYVVNRIAHGPAIAADSRGGILRPRIGAAPDPTGEFGNVYRLFHERSLFCILPRAPWSISTLRPAHGTRLGQMTML